VAELLEGNATLDTSRMSELKRHVGPDQYLRELSYRRNGLSVIADWLTMAQTEEVEWVAGEMTREEMHTLYSTRVREIVDRLKVLYRSL
jgi:hypothetical protein